MSPARSDGHLDAREGDGRGGVGADHQGDEGGPQVSKHVGQLMWGKVEKSGSETLGKHAQHRQHGGHFSHLTSFNHDGRQ